MQNFAIMSLIKIGINASIITTHILEITQDEANREPSLTIFNTKYVFAKIIQLYIHSLFICCTIISREAVQSGRDVNVIIRNICNNIIVHIN